MFDEKALALPGAKRALGVCCALGAAGALGTTGEAVGLAVAVSALWAGAPLDAQVGWIALFFCCFALRQVLEYARDSYMDRFAGAACEDLRTRAATRLYEAGPSYVVSRGRGAVTTTLVEGLAQVRTYLALILPKTAELMTVPAVLGVALLALDPMSGVICILLLPVTVFFMRLLGSYAKENAARQFGAYRRMSNQFADTLGGLSTLQRFGVARHHGKRVFETSERLRKATVATLKTATLSSLVLDLIRVFGLAAVAIMLGFRLMAGTARLVPALAVLVIVPEFFAAVRRYASDFHASLDGRSQLAAVLEIIDAPAEADETGGEPVCVETDGLFRHIDAHGIQFAYPEAVVPALRDVTFAVEAPMKVGIVGASGSGKSTLARLLAGFASPSSGEFALDGAATSTLASAAWRRHVAYIPQEPHIFSATLRENLAFYRPGASEAEVRAAVGRAGLGSLLSELDDGLNTRIGQGGRRLSGGQAQRVALARALLDPERDILVLDEPTAHLDLETELALKEDLLPFMEGKLVFFATHRLHWMREMDLVLVLEKGRLVESGIPDKLLAEGGAFAGLVEALQGGGAR